MKFPRNAKILRSQFDVAPFAAVLFLLVIFVLLGRLLPTPGIRLQPPAAGDLPGTDQPSVAMAVDAQGNMYFDNRIVSAPQLEAALAAAVKSAREPLALVVHADKSVTYDQLVQIALLASKPGIGITNLLGATLPRPEDAPASP
ncbi:MAG TPA: biopolymer transporter ExbD [Verrucomicrobiae bacterium]